MPTNSAPMINPETPGSHGSPAPSSRPTTRGSAALKKAAKALERRARKETKAALLLARNLDPYPHLGPYRGGPITRMRVHATGMRLTEGGQWWLNLWARRVIGKDEVRRRRLEMAVVRRSLGHQDSFGLARPHPRPRRPNQDPEPAPAVQVTSLEQPPTIPATPASQAGGGTRLSCEPTPEKDWSEDLGATESVGAEGSCRVKYEETESESSSSSASEPESEAVIEIMPTPAALRDQRTAAMLLADLEVAIMDTAGGGGPEDGMYEAMNQWQIELLTVVYSLKANFNLTDPDDWRDMLLAISSCKGDLCATHDGTDHLHQHFCREGGKFWTDEDWTKPFSSKFLTEYGPGCTSMPYPARAWFHARGPQFQAFIGFRGSVGGFWFFRAL